MHGVLHISCNSPGQCEESFTRCCTESSYLVLLCATDAIRGYKQLQFFFVLLRRIPQYVSTKQKSIGAIAKASDTSIMLAVCAIAEWSTIQELAVLFEYKNIIMVLYTYPWHWPVSFVHWQRVFPQYASSLFFSMQLTHPPDTNMQTWECKHTVIWKARWKVEHRKDILGCTRITNTNPLVTFAPTSSFRSMPTMLPFAINHAIPVVCIWQDRSPPNCHSINLKTSYARIATR